MCRLVIRQFGSSAIRQLLPAVSAVALIGLPGCRLDMHLQPKVLPLTQSDFYPDGRASRTPPPNTVARGQLRDDTYFYTGMINGKPGDALPFAVTQADLERGRERFNIYCTPCHSRLGDGNGMVVQRGFRRPPSFHTPTLRQAPIGHFFDVITNGFGAMPDYAAQVAPQDRWRIAAYVRALQLSQNPPTGAATAGGTSSPGFRAPSTAPSGATLPPGAKPGGVERK